MAGRPMKFKTVEELQNKIDAYFASCWDEVTIGVDKEGKEIKQRQQIKPYTITGLAAFLECDRDTLLNYEKKGEYFGTIKNAKTKIEAFAEEQLYTPKIAAGVIFNLKNNFGWKDKTEQEINGAIPIKIVDDVK